VREVLSAFRPNFQTDVAELLASETPVDIYSAISGAAIQCGGRKTVMLSGMRRRMQDILCGITLIPLVWGAVL
jgi:hypothetical protein